MTVNISSYHRTNQIIDLLNGKSNFVIDNPYFPLKGSKSQIDNFIEYKELSKDKKAIGYRLQMPAVLYRKTVDEPYTQYYAIRPDNGGSASTTIKLFSPYDSTKSLSVLTKIFTTFGELNDVLKQVCLFDYQIRQAYELLMIVRLLDLNIAECKTDNDVFKLIKDSGVELKDLDKYVVRFQSAEPYKITKRKSKDETDEFGESSEESDETDDLIKLIDSKSLTAKLKTSKTQNNPIFKYYKNKLKPLNPLFTVSSMTSKDSSGPKIAVSANLTFALTIDKAHQGSTTRIHNRKETIMTYKDYQQIQNKRLLAVLCFKFECDIRKYGTNITPVNGMRGMVKSIGYKELTMSSKSYLLDDCADDFIDDDEDAEVPTGNNDEEELMHDDNF